MKRINNPMVKALCLLLSILGVAYLIFKQMEERLTRMKLVRYKLKNTGTQPVNSNSYNNNKLSEALELHGNNAKEYSWTQSGDGVLYLDVYLKD